MESSPSPLYEGTKESHSQCNEAVLADSRPFKNHDSAAKISLPSQPKVSDFPSKPIVKIAHSNDWEELLYNDGCPNPNDNNNKRPGPVAVHFEALTSAIEAGRTKKRQSKGWRFGVACATLMSLVVFLINFILTIGAVTIFKSENGIATAYEGSCDKVDKWTTWLHVLINILSSLLLSASNYTMQCLCAPTRKELDKAHAKGDWLDIGVPSVRNICGRISRKRILVWWILGLSSIPIHLLYNSAVFKTKDGNMYDIVVANEEFLTGTPVTNKECEWIREDPLAASPLRGLHEIQSFFAENFGKIDTSVVQKLSNKECIASYGSMFTSGRSDVLLVTSKRKSNITTFVWNVEKGGFATTLAYVPFGWICNTGENRCNIQRVQKDATNWIVFNIKIDYCLSKITPKQCKLQIATYILATVTVLNAFKGVAMLWTLLKQKEETLVTIGDAVASFLRQPDAFTRGRCLLGIPRGPSFPSTEALRPETFGHPGRLRWSVSASARRWVITLGMPLVMISVCTTLLLRGVNAMRFALDGASPFSTGFGKADTRTMILSALPEYGASGLACSVLLANSPQALCSLCYLAYNGLLTSMLSCSEWSAYFLRPKALRVTTPRGKQRSSYYLHLPFLYAIPLLVAFTTLHWLISESIFLVRFDNWYKGSPTGRPISSDGYSPQAVLCAILLGTAILLTILCLAFRRLSSPMPVVRSCSFAIAAACHRPVDDTNAAVCLVSWGEVNNMGTEEVGHCCFTSKEVHNLVPGRKYT